MTPKEKAAELVKQFDECLNHIAIGSNGIEDHLLERAKACALICVVVMINKLEQIRKPANTLFIEAYKHLSIKDGYEEKYYWEQVNDEILKM